MSIGQPAVCPIYLSQVVRFAEVFLSLAIQDPIVLDNIAGSFWVLLLIMLPVGPAVGKPGLPGSFETGLPVLADLLPTAGVLVVGVT